MPFCYQCGYEYQQLSGVKLCPNCGHNLRNGRIDEHANPLNTDSMPDIDTKTEETSKSYLQIKNVLYDVNRIEKESGIDIEEIKIGNLQISKNELSLDELILKGNEHFYKNQYNEAIECFNKALEIDPSYNGGVVNKVSTIREIEAVIPPVL